MKPKLRHTLNRAWLKIELNKLKVDKDRVLLLAYTNKEKRDVQKLICDVSNEVFKNNELAEILDEYRLLFLSEEAFKEGTGAIFLHYNSFLMSHDITDVFFKNALFKYRR